MARRDRRRDYDANRDTGDGDDDDEALHAPANWLVAIIHGCLKYQTAHNEDTASCHRGRPNAKSTAAFPFSSADV